MLVKCLNCGYEFYGKILKDKLGKHCECEKCGSSFDVTEPELTFKATKSNDLYLAGKTPKL